MSAQTDLIWLRTRTRRSRIARHSVSFMLRNLCIMLFRMNFERRAELAAQNPQIAFEEPIVLSQIGDEFDWQAHRPRLCFRSTT